MDTRKLIVILLVLVIVFSAITIIVNFSIEGKQVNQAPDIIINDRDDSSTGEVGLIVLPKGGAK